MKDIPNEFLAFIGKWWIWFVYVLMGIAAKFSYDLLTNKKISFWSAIGSIGIAGFTGYLSCVWCFNNAPDKAPYIVPLATLLSDKFFTWLFAIDWKALFELITNTKTDNK